MGSSDMDNLKKPSRLSTGLRRGLGLPAITMAAVLAPSLVLAGDLNEISYDRASDGTVQVHFTLSEPLVGEPNSFKIDNPARVAIDLPDVGAAEHREYDLVSGGLVTRHVFLV